MISNGFFLRPDLIEALNEAGLQEMQISIDGVQANDTTQKVLANLKKRLQWLREYAVFESLLVAFSVHAPHERLKRCSLLPSKWALSHAFCSFTIMKVS